MPEFHIRIASDEMVFDAAHFITTADGCERLHGHSYRVTAEVFGPLDEHQCVVDFLLVRKVLGAIVAELNHRVLLPTRHPGIRVSQREREIEAVCGQRRWVFPHDNCLLLPLANTTTELLAQYIAQRLASGWPPATASRRRGSASRLEKVPARRPFASCRSDARAALLPRSSGTPLLLLELFHQRLGFRPHAEPRGAFQRALQELPGPRLVPAVDRHAGDVIGRVGRDLAAGSR